MAIELISKTVRLLLLYFVAVRLLAQGLIETAIPAAQVRGRRILISATIQVAAGGRAALQIFARCRELEHKSNRGDRAAGCN